MTKREAAQAFRTLARPQTDARAQQRRTPAQDRAAKKTVVEALRTHTRTTDVPATLIPGTVNLPVTVPDRDRGTTAPPWNSADEIAVD